MAHRVGIMADDLTGAGDTAVQFVRAGWVTELQLISGPSGAEVIAITTDSRNLPPAAAADAVAGAVGRLRQAGVARLYKKIDSTLRGNLRAELDAAMRAWSPRATAIVCPAFPATGRTVRDGALLLDGVPVADTALRNDPVTPVTESHLPTLLGVKSSIAPQTGEADGHFAERLRRSGPIAVVDAVDNDDLLKLARAIALLDADAIPVGSAGLARHLARQWRPADAATVIVVVTSQQDVARRQAAAVESTGTSRCEPPVDELVDDEAWTRVSAKIVEQLHESPSTILLTAPRDRHASLPAELIPRRLAELAIRLIAGRPRGGVSGIVVTGGDGARALVEALGATGIALCGEVVTGVPLGTLIGGTADGLAIVTKAGGFGGEDALVRSIEAVRERRTR